MSTDFNKEISNIVKNVTELSNKKNINEIMELRNKNDEMIKNTIAKLKKIKSNFESNDVKIMENMTDEKYEKVSSKISDNEIAKIQTITNLEEKIDAYKNLAMKIKSCIQFLENKKINIIDCDNDLQNTTQSVEQPTKITSQKISQSKKQATSSDTDSDSVKTKQKTLKTKTKPKTKKTSKNSDSTNSS